jgi:DNA mismatch repair ATPase MutS
VLAQGDDTTFPDWTVAFETGSQTYYRCQETVHLDETVGDVATALREREEHVLRSIEHHLVPFRGAVTVLTEMIGEFDVVASLATVCTVSGADHAGSTAPRPMCRTAST